MTSLRTFSTLTSKVVQELRTAWFRPRDTYEQRMGISFSHQQRPRYFAVRTQPDIYCLCKKERKLAKFSFGFKNEASSIILTKIK